MFSNPRIYLHVSIHLFQDVRVRLHVSGDDTQRLTMLVKHFEDTAQQFYEEVAYGTDAEDRAQSRSKARKIGKELVDVHIRLPI